MNTKMILGGAALLLLASSMAASAYHINGSAGPIGTSHQWNGATAVADPTTGEILFALTICEQDDFFGLPPLPVVATPGMGGLCSMSPGYGMVGGACVATAARSNGVGPDYTSSGACGSTGTATVGADWIDVQMLNTAVTPVPFIGQIDGFSCALATTTFRYDGRFAYTTDGGHVTGFPTEFAAYLLPGVGNPLALGTYTTSAAPAAVAAGCDAPRPFDQI